MQGIEESRTGLEIAIIGMAGRFPGAKSIEEFWKNLKEGVHSITFFSEEEIESTGIVNTEELKNPDYVKAKGVLEDIEYFDAEFFDFSPREAVLLDPQIRFLHMCCYEALEDAGYASERYNGLIALFAGASHNFHWEANAFSNLPDSAKQFTEQHFVDKDFMTTRVSYKLNLRGPSVYVYTTCSTGLVAIHLACQSLLGGECDIALAGAVTILLPQKIGYLYQDGLVYSRDGYCRSFDAKATGFIDSNGIGVVALKRLEDALADGDHMYAVIKGTAINNDGRRKIGYAATSMEGQTEVVKAALDVSEVDPESITYIEAHGSATPMGDPIEIKSLTRAFNTDKLQYCRIGSVKTNIGHLDTASGMAGFIKTALALKHQQIPPSLHFTTPNPKIDFKNSPFYVNTTLTEWKSEHPLRAGINSLGQGGTNAHVILEEPPRKESSATHREYSILMLSAKTETALDAMTANLAEYLQSNPAVNLADVAYTLQVGREHWRWRRTVVCSDVQEAIDALSAKPGDPVFLEREQTPSVVFMFPGQGAQYVDMGLGLYETEPIFREEMDRCFAILQSLLGYEMKTILYPSYKREEAEKRILDTEVAQPLIFVFEYALAKLLMNWGIMPTAMIGYSFGEYTAACLSGVVSLEEALHLIATRGKLMGQVPEGAMLSVPLSEEALLPYLHEELSLAVVNGPSCIVAGSEEAIKAFEEEMQRNRFMCMRVTGALAAHSKELEDILPAFEREVQRVSLHKPAIPYISNITGTWMTEKDAISPHYWTQHMRKTVRFADGIKELLKDEHTLFVEVGPGVDLSVLIRRFIEDKPQERIVNTIRHPQKEMADDRFLLSKIGRLWACGVSIDWQQFYRDETRYRIPLPSYPFDYQYYWIDEEQVLGIGTVARKLYKKKSLQDWFYVPSWKFIPLSPEPKEALEEQMTWLVCIDECGLGERLVESFTHKQQQVVTVRIGSEFSIRNEREYVINPQSESDYNHLFYELSKKDLPPQQIVYLWGVTPGVHTSNSSLSEYDIELGFYSLVNLIKALKHRDKRGHQITVVSNNMQNVTGKETLCVEKSLVLGLCKTIPQEYPDTICRSIDVEFPDDDVEVAQLTDNLLLEMRVEAESSDVIIAYRKNKRWVQQFEPVSVDRAPTAPWLKEQGVYLIVGGLGRIGLAIGEYLAKTVHAKLILTGRSEFPAKEKWEYWLSEHSADESISRKITTLKQMETQGAEVVILQADICNQDRMRHVIEESERQFGKIDGLIHAAGKSGKAVDCPIEEINKATYEEIFQPKLQGLLVLEEVLRKKKLDFCVITSSIASVLGGLGLSEYTASHIFMDSFVSRHNLTDDTQWISINWDLWPSGEEELEKEERSSLGVSVQEAMMTAEEGIEVFERILSWYQNSQIIVATVDLQKRIDRWLNPAMLRGIQTSLKEPDSSLIQDTSFPDEETENGIQQTLINIWRGILGIEHISINDDFFELGADSLLAAQAAYQLKTEGYDVVVGDIFQYRTTKSLALYIAFLKKREALIDDVLEAEERLSSDLDIECRIIKYIVEENEFYVFFVSDDHLERTGELLRFIEENFLDTIHPHYILPFSQKPESNASEIVMDRPIFSELLHLKTGNAFWTIGKLVGKIKKEEGEYHKQLMNGAIIQEYPISSIQRAYIESVTDLAGTNVFYNRSIDPQHLKKVIRRIIDEQGLLRSVFINKNGEFLIREFVTPDDIYLPVIDISPYAFDVQEKMIQEIIKRYNLLRLKERFNAINYRLLLLKQNMRAYCLIFVHDHLLGDLFATYSWRRYLLRYYEDEYAEQEISLTYRDFVEQLSKGPQNITADEVIESFHLQAFKRSFDILGETVERRRDRPTTEIVVKFPLSHANVEEEQDKFWDISFVIFCNLCHALFKIQELPVSLTHHGRVNGGKKFFGIIGPFAAPLPVLIHVDEDKPEDMLTEMKNKIETASKYNLNFFHLLVAQDKLRDGWEKIIPLITNNTFKAPTMLSFNFLGEFEKIQLDIENQGPGIADEVQAGIEDVQLGLQFNVMYTEEDIRFAILDKFGHEEIQIKEIIEEQADMFLMD